MTRRLPLGLFACATWLWSLTPIEAQGPMLQPLQRLGGFDDWVTSVAVSPDGRLLAAGTYDLVRLWNLDESRELGTLKTACGFAQALAFTPDGSRLIVGGYQQTQLWDPAAQKKLAALRGHRGYVRGVALSPDGTQLATASEDRTVRLWSLAEGRELRTLGPLESAVLGVAWSPGGELLAAAAGDETRLTRPGQVTLWNPQTGELVKTLPDHAKAATAVAFSPDGRWLLSTSLDERVNVYDLKTGEAHGSFDGHSRPVNCVLFPPGRSDVALSASGGRFQGGNEIKLFRPADGTEYATLEAHEGKVTALAVTPDGRRLISASYDKTAAVWDLATLLAAVPAETESPSSPSTAAEADSALADPTPETKTMRIGIIGLDTSHAVAFTKLLNAETPPPALAGCRVVAAYPRGSADIQSSVSRIPGYTEDVKKLGVEIVDSIDALLERVDAVLLETNDGRPHLEQVLPVLRAHKPVFVDKPIAASLVDCIAIQEAARHYQTPLFSASSLRFLGQAREVRGGEYGAVVGCDTYSPCSLEPTHPDLYWYGIHGVEALFAVMGPGCQTVARASTPEFEFVTGVWQDGRIGTFRGLRAGARGYGGTAYTEKKVVPLGPYPGYQPLVESIVHFFRSGEAPVTAEETLEIYAFMSAADESKRLGGAPVNVPELVQQARVAAAEKLRRLIPEDQPPGEKR